jgi:hypothetical protein
MTELKPCPFCGDDPWVGGYDGGTDYEGPRCCWGSVDFQIVDIIPDETRFSEDAYNKETQQYRDDIVAFAADYAVKEWNTRQSPWISVEDRLPEAKQGCLLLARRLRQRKRGLVLRTRQIMGRRLSNI